MIARENVSDVEALRMMSDENADSWAMGPQHALLCVKQARDYLEHGPSRIIIRDVFNGSEEAYNKCMAHGAGFDAILKLLAGSWTERAVRDALAVLKSKHVDPRVAGQFTNLHQARAYLENGPSSTIVPLLFDGDRATAAAPIGQRLTGPQAYMSPQRLSARVSTNSPARHRDTALLPRCRRRPTHSASLRHNTRQTARTRA